MNRVNRPRTFYYPVSILYKSIAGRYRPVRVADGPMTARYRFIKNANWVLTAMRRFVLWVTARCFHVLSCYCFIGVYSLSSLFATELFFNCCLIVVSDILTILLGKRELVALLVWFVACALFIFPLKVIGRLWSLLLWFVAWGRFTLPHKVIGRLWSLLVWFVACALFTLPDSHT